MNRAGRRAAGAHAPTSRIPKAYQTDDSGPGDVRLWVRHEPSAWLYAQVAVLDRAFADPATLKCCVHLWKWIAVRAESHPGRPPRPDEWPAMNAAVWQPGEVVCEGCWDAGTLLAPDVDRCDRCSVYGPLALGSLTIPPYTLHAKLCAACAGREAPAGTELGAGRTR